MTSDRDPLYFISRVHIFTPATANYLSMENAYHILTRRQLAMHIVDSCSGGGPNTIDQIMRADNNHGSFWPLQYVHQIDDTHVFYNADKDRKKVIRDLLLRDEGLGYSNFSDATLWHLLDTDWSNTRLLQPSKNLQNWFATLSAHCEAFVKTGTWPTSAYAEGTFWPKEQVRFSQISGGENLIDAMTDYLDKLVTIDLNNKTFENHRAIVGVRHVDPGLYSRFAGALFGSLLNDMLPTSKTHTALSIYGYAFMHAGDAVKNASFIGNVAEVADKILSDLPLEPIGSSDLLSSSRWPLRHGSPLLGLTKLDRALEHYQEPSHPYPLSPVPHEWKIPQAALLRYAAEAKGAGSPKTYSL